MQRITPEGGAPTHAYPDASYHSCPPASIPYARSLARGALSAHSSGEVVSLQPAANSHHLKTRYNTLISARI